MARKSKKIKADISNVPEIATSQKDSLTYQGKVLFQVLHGNKVISTKQYSNNGLPDLFKFIGFALAGSYYASLRPCKVALYDCITTGDPYGDPTKFDWNDYLGHGALEIISPYVVYDATPVVKATKDGYSTTFRFKIPFNWLYKKTFNTLGLFNADNVACAYYLFTKEQATEDTVTKIWENQILDDQTGDYSIVIEWTLTISNK